mmetsp:Transcript_122055/g.227998  ORF Transcript_122055/g.227998 Transcript_122055/m.227998 type:complete len:83 (-) Transcript_122055:42-290(-)
MASRTLLHVRQGLTTHWRVDQKCARVDASQVQIEQPCAESHGMIQTNLILASGTYNLHPFHKSKTRSNYSVGVRILKVRLRH